MTRTITSAEMETLAWEIANHFEIVEKHGDNSYTTHCPVHGGNCLRVSPKGQILFVCYAGDPRCTQAAIRAKIIEAGFDLDVICQEGFTGKSGKKSHVRQNPIAHDQIPYDWKGKTLAHRGKDGIFEHHPITACYTYTTELGEIVFYQLRADTPTINKHGKHEKILKVYSSFYNEQTKENFWDYALSLKNRPLYNLKEIVDNPDKPVLLVEGEKACEAAKRLFPKYVCTCYSLGLLAWPGTDLKPLRGREVTLWPDNSQKAIDEFLRLAELLDPAPKIVMLEKLGDRPDDWDVADELPMAAVDHDVLLDRAQPVNKTRNLSPEDEAAVVEKYNQNLRVLWVGGTMHVYDKNIILPNDTWLPYRYLTFADLSKIYPEKIVINKIGKGGRGSIAEAYAVDVWRDSPSKIVSHGIAYDPSTTEELLRDRHGNYETNKFLGWGVEAKPCDPKHYAPFLDHIHHIMDPLSAKFFINFIAHMVQKPKEKPGVLPILIGKQFTGKTLIGGIVQAMLGERNVLIIDGNTFLSKWSGQFSGKIALFVDEFSTKGMAMDFMNTLLTDKRVTLEHKGKNLTSELSYHRAIGTTNSGAFTISADDRRLFPISIVNKSINSFNKDDPKNETYFAPIKAMLTDINCVGLAGLLDYFLTYKMDMNVMVSPTTAFKKVRMVQSNPVHDIIYQMCDSGNLPSEFGKTVCSHIGDGRMPNYPEKVYRSDMHAMLKKMYPKNTESPASITDEFMKFIAPANKKGTMRQAFYRDGSALRETSGADRYFELPPLEELRARYNRLVDPTAEWEPVEDIPDTIKRPSHLRIVKDEPDEGGLI